MKFQYLYMASISGATIYTDNQVKYGYAAVNMQWVERKIPAGRLIKTPLHAPSWFPVLTDDEKGDNRYFVRINKKVAIAKFGLHYIDQLDDNCDITMAAISIPVEHWGKAGEFENLVDADCEIYLKPRSAPSAFISGLLDSLHYDDRFDAYFDDDGTPHYLEIAPSYTHDGNPHVIQL